MGDKSILLADSDPQSAEAFRRAVGPRWEVTEVLSGTAAMAEMKRCPHDVVVADLALPDMGGGQLLNRIRSTYPKTVRFILANDDDKAHVMKQVLGAHQFLTKPFDHTTLRSTIEQALALDTWISNNSVRELVSRVRTFPTIPSLYLEVLTVLKSPNSTTAEVGAIIAKDMAMMTKLLQVLNSTLFSLPRQISDPAEAVSLLGFEAVKSMVMAIKLLGQYDKIKPVYFSVDRLWRHSTEVAQIAKTVALLQTGDPAKAEAAFTGGLMHDLGKVVLAANFEEQYRGVQSVARRQEMPLWELEKEIFGATHGEIGAYLLGLWGMPMELLEVAAFHHFPTRSPQKEFTSLTAVHVADVLAHEANPDAEEWLAPKLDEEYLAEIGLLDRVETWRDAVHLLDGPRGAAVKNKTVTTVIAAPSSPAEAAPSVEGQETESESGGQGKARIWLYVAAAVSLFLLLVGYLSFGGWRGQGKSPPPGTGEPAKGMVLGGDAAHLAAATVGRAQKVQAASTSDSPKEPSPPDNAPVAGRPDLLGSGASAAGKAVTSNEVSSQAIAKVVEEKPAVAQPKLQGIFFSKENPTAMIDGQLVRVHSAVAGGTVLEIQRSSVTLGFGDQQKILTLK